MLMAAEHRRRPITVDPHGAHPPTKREARRSSAHTNVTLIVPKCRTKPGSPCRAREELGRQGGDDDGARLCSPPAMLLRPHCHGVRLPARPDHPGSDPDGTCCALYPERVGAFPAAGILPCAGVGGTRRGTCGWGANAAASTDSTSTRLRCRHPLAVVIRPIPSAAHAGEGQARRRRFLQLL